MSNKKYINYVEHPRYGKFPQYTGLDPDCRISRLHGGNIIPKTAIEADVSKQVDATVPISYYFDMDQVCRKCSRPFIFFAEEQKYWYEELGFYLWSVAVCCPSCRKELRVIRRLQKKYEQLIHVANPSVDELFEMANVCLTLVEEGVFHARQTEHVRAIINRIPAEQHAGEQYEELVTRLHNIEHMETEN